MMTRRTDRRARGRAGRVAALLAVVSASLLPAAPAPAATPTYGCGRSHASGTSVHTLDDPTGEREYLLTVPDGYTGQLPLPLVVNLHGLGSSAREQYVYSRLDTAGAERGFVVVTPDGRGRVKHWVLSGLPGSDDRVLDRLIARVAARLCIDADRVYVAGISNGAAMASSYACDRRNRVRAVGSVSGLTACGSEGRPVPVIAFHGTGDPIVPYEGGLVFGRVPYAPVPDIVADWARHNHCSPTPHDRRVTEDVVRRSFYRCRLGSTVVLYTIEEGGHTWPGSFDVPKLGRTTHTIDATDLMLDFFSVPRD